jgi:hypothetical protein
VGNATIGRGIGAEGASNAAMRALFETSGIASSGSPSGHLQAATPKKYG